MSASIMSPSAINLSAIQNKTTSAWCCSAMSIHTKLYSLNRAHHLRSKAMGNVLHKPKRPSSNWNVYPSQASIDLGQSVTSAASHWRAVVHRFRRWDQLQHSAPAAQTYCSFWSQAVTHGPKLRWALLRTNPPSWLLSNLCWKHDRCIASSTFRKTINQPCIPSRGNAFEVLLTIWCSLVAIVQHSPIWTRCSNACVGLCPTTSMELAMVQEHALQLVFHHPWFAPTHKCHVCPGANLIGIPLNLHFFSQLDLQQRTTTKTGTCKSPDGSCSGIC